VLSTLAKNIIHSVLYFDIFGHPLTQEELTGFVAGSVTEQQLKQQLEDLVAAGLLFTTDGYYSVDPDLRSLIDRRLEAERMARSQWDKAHRRARLIGKFPYVRAAYISGSMSKGVMHEHGDVDYFIITEPGRLWVARTLLVLYKKTVLFNSRKFFCLNYFIDSEMLEIEEKNYFTAVETVTLRPAYDNGMYHRFLQANRWVEAFIPSSRPGKVIHNGETGRMLAGAIERSLNNPIGDRLDQWLMRLTLWVWKRKFGHMATEHFEVAMKTRKYVSKHHPRNFQSRVLNALQQRISDFEQKHNVKVD